MEKFVIKPEDLKSFHLKKPGVIKQMEKLFWTRGELKKKMKNGKQKLLLVTQNGILIGGLIMVFLSSVDKKQMRMSYPEKTVELRYMNVNPRFRKLKTCRILILETVKYLKDKGLANRLTLDVVKTQSPMVEIYRRNGFHIVTNHHAHEWINSNFHLKYQLGPHMAHRYRVMILTSLI